MLVDKPGRAYVGNFGIDDAGAWAPTNLVLVAADGTASVAAKDLMFPNGAVVTPDGKRLLISETFAHRITSFAVGADGQLTDRCVWADFAAAGISTSISEPGTPVLPDGLALDESGAGWVADATGCGILRVAEGGTVLEAISTGERSVFAAALGGADRRTLYLCAAPPLGAEDPSEHRHGVLMSCRVDVPGAGLP
jgi:sugar lactone lactonase YvrE